MFFPYYLIADVFMLWMLGFLLTSFLIALVVILRAFQSPRVYQERQDDMHYRGVKRSLLRAAESLARELSYGE